MKFGTLTIALSLVLAVSMPMAGANALEMRGDTIYMMLPDRFFDGDASNNTAVDPSLYDPNKQDWQKFWGGDLAGIKQKLDYLQAIGASTIWTTPVYQNAPVIGTYHGYQMQDLFRVEPRMGTWASFSQLTCDMHSRGMKYMLDISLNAGPSTSAGFPNGSQCLIKKDGVIKTTYANDVGGWFRKHGPIDWGNFTYWDQVNKDIFGLADFNQDTQAVRDYLKQGAALWQYYGVDSFRLDAAKHYEPSWGREWMDSVNASANWLGREGTYAVAEWYGGGAYNNESKWWISTAGTAMKDFQLQEVLRGVAGEWRSMFELRDALYGRHAAYGTDGSGGQNVHWQVNFFDSHDTQRLIIPLADKYGWQNLPEVKQRVDMLLGLMVMLPGIPCVYYGTEQYLYDTLTNIDGLKGGDPYNRPMMSSFDTNTPAAQALKKASDLRKIHPAVQYGDIVERWIDSGVFVFSRQSGSNAVLVGVNNTWQSRTVGVSSIPFPNGTYDNVLDNTGDINVNNGFANVTIPARSTVIFSHLPNPISPAANTDIRCNMAAPNQSGPAATALVIDGANISANFAGRLRATQLNPTQFGDSNGSGNGSELNQLFITNDGSSLLLGITGNLEQNGNFLLVFLETGSGGENVISASAGPQIMTKVSGTMMDEGFAPRYCLAINIAGNGVFYADLVDIVTNTHRFLGAGSVNSGSGGLGGGDNAGEQIAINNTNAVGVTSSIIQNANTATTGFDIRLPFNSIGLLSNSIKAFALVTGSQGFISNQSLPGMGVAVAGGYGAYKNIGNAPVDFGKIAGNQFVSVNLTGITYTTYATPAQLKAQPDGSRVALSNMTGIGAFPTEGYFYIQHPTGMNGIRVNKPTTPMAEINQQVTVRGFLGTQNGERVINLTEQVLGGPVTAIEAVGVKNLNVGGQATNGNPAMPQGVGLSNTGILVRAWGKVKALGVDENAKAFFYVDDGSGVKDGSGNGDGIRVYSTITPPVDAWVTVKGISSVITVNGLPKRAVITRLPGDISTNP